MYKKIQKIIKQCERNPIKCILFGIIIYMLYTRYLEKFESKKRFITLLRPKGGDHHINLARLEIFDEKGKKIPLNFESVTDYATENYHPNKLLDGDNNTIFHSAYHPTHKWIKNKNNKQDKSVIFSYPANKTVKRIYIRNRNNCCQKRAANIKIIIQDGIEKLYEKKLGSSKMDYTFELNIPGIKPKKVPVKKRVKIVTKVKKVPIKKSSNITLYIIIGIVSLLVMGGMIYYYACPRYN